MGLDPHKPCGFSFFGITVWRDELVCVIFVLYCIRVMNNFIRCQSTEFMWVKADILIPDGLLTVVCWMSGVGVSPFVLCTMGVFPSLLKLCEMHPWLWGGEQCVMWCFVEVFSANCITVLVLKIVSCVHEQFTVAQHPFLRKEVFFELTLSVRRTSSHTHDRSYPVVCWCMCECVCRPFN